MSNTARTLISGSGPLHPPSFFPFPPSSWPYLAGSPILHAFLRTPSTTLPASRAETLTEYAIHRPFAFRTTMWHGACTYIPTYRTVRPCTYVSK